MRGMCERLPYDDCRFMRLLRCWHCRFTGCFVADITHAISKPWGKPMRSEELLRRFVAVTLLFSTLFVTMPISAAELAPSRTTLGSVSGSGAVSLRGVSLQEGTIFNGDVLEVGYKGYARVMFVAGHRLELDANTKISIHQADDNISV